MRRACHRTADRWARYSQATAMKERCSDAGTRSSDASRSRKPRMADSAGSSAVSADLARQGQRRARAGVPSVFSATAAARSSSDRRRSSPCVRRQKKTSARRRGASGRDACHSDSSGKESRSQQPAGASRRRDATEASLPNSSANISSARRCSSSTGREWREEPKDSQHSCTASRPSMCRSDGTRPTGTGGKRGSSCAHPLLHETTYTVRASVSTSSGQKGLPVSTLAWKRDCRGM